MSSAGDLERTIQIKLYDVRQVQRVHWLNMFQVDIIGFSRRYDSFENKMMMVFSCVAHSANQRFHVP